MSSCFPQSVDGSAAIRYSAAAVLVSVAVMVAFACAAGTDAGQKVATALEEMSLVMALLLLHLTVSKIRGSGAKKTSKTKVSDDCDAYATDDAAQTEQQGQSENEAFRQQAIGKITTKIRAAVKMGDMPAAEALMRHMQDIGGAPGYLRRACWSVAFGEIVNGYVRNGDAKNAGKWLDSFAACAPVIRPSSACANSVIATLCSARDFSQAEEWLARMPRVGIRVDAETYSALVNGCVRAGEVARGIHWLREMRKANLRPSAELNKLVLQACAEGRGSAVN